MANEPIKLSKVERLILANQFRILSELNNENAECYRYKDRITILESGFVTYYDQIIGGIEDPISESLCHQVEEVLRLFDAIYESTGGKPPQKLKFQGFDHNTEDEALSFAQFLYARHGYQYLPPPQNSHMPMLPIYRRLLEKSKKMGQRLTYSEQELGELIDA